jgi:hypothetical protein
MKRLSIEFSASSFRRFGSFGAPGIGLMPNHNSSGHLRYSLEYFAHCKGCLLPLSLSLRQQHLHPLYDQHDRQQSPHRHRREAAAAEVNFRNDIATNT